MYILYSVCSKEITQCTVLKGQAHAGLIVIATEKVDANWNACFPRSDAGCLHMLHLLGDTGHFVPCFEMNRQVLTSFHMNEIKIVLVIQDSM